LSNTGPEEPYYVSRIALTQHYSFKRHTGHFGKAIGFIEIEDRGEKSEFLLVAGNKTYW